MTMSDGTCFSELHHIKFSAIRTMGKMSMLIMFQPVAAADCFPSTEVWALKAVQKVNHCH
jgi:hypothetical protein